MALMMSSFYDASLNAGAEDGTARRAAEEVAAYSGRFSRLESDTALLKWMLGFNLAMTAAVLAKLLA